MASGDDSNRLIRRLRGAYVAGDIGLDTLERQLEATWAPAQDPPPRETGRRWRRMPRRWRLATASTARRHADVLAIAPPPVGPQVQWILGRGSGADLRLDDLSVSRRHAALIRSGDGWHVRDLQSMNGTFVNGWRVTEAELERGDVLELGGTAITLR